MNKDETPWSMDIYFNMFQKNKKILKNKIKTRIVYPPLNSQKYKQFKKIISLKLLL